MHVFILVVVVACCFQTVSAQSDHAEEQTVRLEMASADGTVRVHIESSMPKERTPLLINVKFSNTVTGSILHDVNYDFVAMQNGEIVLSQMGMYAEGGTAQHVTAPLSTDNQVEVMIVLQGIGSEAPILALAAKQLR